MRIPSLVRSCLAGAALAVAACGEGAGPGPTERDAAALDARRATLTALAERLAVDEAVDRAALAALEEVAGELRRRLDVAGARATTGYLLRRHRASLPSEAVVAARIEARAEEIALAQLEALEIDAERRHLDLPDGAAALARQSALDALAAALDGALAAWTSRDAAERALLDAVRSFGAFVDERLIWIRSAPPLWEATPGELGAAAAAFVDPEVWRGAARDAVRGVPSLGLGAQVALLAALAALGLRPRLRRLAAESPSPARAWLAAAVAAAASPVVVALLGSRLCRMDASGDAAGALGLGIGAASGRVALAWAGLAWVRELTRTERLARRHLGWGADVTRALHRASRWWLATALPAWLVVTVLEAQPVEGWTSPLERTALVLGLVLAAVPMRAVAAAATARRSAAAVRLGPGAAIAAPLVLAALVVLGYTHTALALVEHGVATVALVGIAHVAVRGACRPSSTADRPLGPLARGAVGVALTAGLVALWADLVPALGILRRVVLWQHVVPVTLADAGLAVLWLVATGLALRHAGALLDVLAARRIRVAAGDRYAVTALLRYGVATVGLVAAARALHVGWTSVQWLAAGLSVGLGFGLQEIFANTVSGLLLFVERPVRVGDYVTVGEVSGRVTAIRMRATTILDLDQRELIVPNRELVTGQLVNWTLSDPVSCVTVPVGLAYDADVERARALLLEAARAAPLVARTPEPSVAFVRLGESALELELRAFVADRDRIPELLDQIHTGLVARFRAAGLADALARPDECVHLHGPGPRNLIAAAGI